MSQPLRIGMIGAGSAAKLHLPAFGRYPQQLHLAAVADVNQQAAEACAAQGGTDAVYTDPRDMIAHAAIDAVEILCPNDQHAPLALAAIAAGKHVLVEKPMAGQWDACRQMVTAAGKAGVTLMVGQCQRYDPVHSGVRDLIEEGQIGAILAVRMDCMQHLPAFFGKGSFYYDARRAGGGVVISLAIHNLDLMRLLVGEIRQVTAIGRRTNPQFAEGTEDLAVALLEFANGAVGELFATYSGVRMPWGEQYMIFGQTGTIHTLPPIGHYTGSAWVARDTPIRANGWIEQYQGFTPLEPGRRRWPSDDKYTNELLHFAECCRTGQEALSSGVDNLKTMQVIFALYQSMQTGQPVTLQPEAVT